MARPNVYTYFDDSASAPSNQCNLLRLWARSWSARGWSPRILTVRNAQAHPRFATYAHDIREMPRLAQEAADVKWLCPVEAINFHFTPRQCKKTGPPLYRPFHSAGWEGAAVVWFENIHDMSIIEHCGRPL